MVMKKRNFTRSYCQTKSYHPSVAPKNGSCVFSRTEAPNNLSNLTTLLVKPYANWDYSYSPPCSAQYSAFSFTMAENYFCPETFFLSSKQVDEGQHRPSQLTNKRVQDVQSCVQNIKHHHHSLKRARAHWKRERAKKKREREVGWVMTRKQCLLDTTGQLTR